MTPKEIFKAYPMVNSFHTSQTGDDGWRYVLINNHKICLYNFVITLHSENPMTDTSYVRLASLLKLKIADLYSLFVEIANQKEGRVFFRADFEGGPQS